MLIIIKSYKYWGCIEGSMQKSKFQRNEARLAQLVAAGRYCYDDYRWPALYPEAARIEKEQDRLLEQEVSGKNR